MCMCLHINDMYVCVCVCLCLHINGIYICVRAPPQLYDQIHLPQNGIPVDTFF